ncbi:MAG TPA: hypothetical protein VFB79_17695 [Candidatus Angelobacter sp.]|nr:hypothetical protein [Candidatus Angelobacter sp.]
MPKKLVLKLAVLMFSLATLQAMQHRPTASTNFLCRTQAQFCSTNTSGGHCGFRVGEDCNTCYGIDGSTLSGGCPQPIQ